MVSNINEYRNATLTGAVLQGHVPYRDRKLKNMTVIFIQRTLR